jgi:hypothetical protein
MKLPTYAILILTLLLSQCSSLDKEILEIEKQKLEVERERLKLERDRLHKCNNCCQQPTLSLKTEVKPILPLEEKAVFYVEPMGCNKVKTPSSEDIWQISETGEWSYPPNFLELGITCKEEKKEYFYKQFSNTESYVAEKQVPATKKSSCINNVVFHGKDKLYTQMVEKTKTEELSKEMAQRVDSKMVFRDVVEYNNSAKGRSFYYECKATDSQKRWDKCACVLFASYTDGKEGLADRMVRY